MLATSDIRRRWRGMVVLTLLVGVVGAVVLAATAGARRSDSALTRFNRASRTAQLELTVGNPTPAQLAAFRRVRGVAAFVRLRTDALSIPRAPQFLAFGEAVDTRFGTVVDRPRVIEGRNARPSAPDEITI